MKATTVCIKTVIDAGLLGLSLYYKASQPPVPQNAQFPYITLQEISSVEIESHDGRSFLKRAIIQINCWDKSYTTAYALRDKVNAVLLPFSGPVLDVVFQGFNHVLDAELYDANRELHQLISRLQVYVEYADLHVLPIIDFGLLDFPIQSPLLDFPL